MRVAAPQEPGEYRLVLTLVQEDQFWFDQISQPVAVEWHVTVVSEKPAAEGVTLLDVAGWTSATVIRDGTFANLGFLSDPQERMLTFVESRHFASAAIACPETACVLTRPELAELFPERIGVAVAAEPKRCFFEIHNRLERETHFYGLEFASIIDADAQLHPRCWVDEKNVIISAGVRIGPNASVLGRAFLEERVTVHAGAVIGSAGFQTSYRGPDAIELLHAGGVEIGPDSHIFANAVIARGLFRQSTRLGQGCRVGNGAFISHNCVLGDGVFAGHGAVVNGNVTIGANAWIGPGATVVHGVVIGEGAQVSLGATLIRNVQAGKRVTGSLAMEHRKMLRLMAKAEKGREL
jgi:UDP-3-O-[3-hydroxymyristoyl] glucosamine N-acyltransferase